MCTDFPPKNSASGECFYFSISVLHFLTAYFISCRKIKCVHVPFCIVPLFLNPLSPTSCAGVMYPIQETGRSCSSFRKSLFSKCSRYSFPIGNWGSSDSAVWHFAFYSVPFLQGCPFSTVGLSWTLSGAAGTTWNQLLPTETSQPNPSRLPPRHTCTLFIEV